MTSIIKHDETKLDQSQHGKVCLSNCHASMSHAATFNKQLRNLACTLGC